MESQTVLKTAGGKTLAGSTPVPSVIQPTILIVSPEKYKWFCDLYDEINRENANGKQGDC